MASRTGMALTPNACAKLCTVAVRPGSMPPFWISSRNFWRTLSWIVDRETGE